VARYKVVVDREKCLSCGAAPALCPDVFELAGPDMKNKVKAPYETSTDEKTSTGIIPEKLLDCARNAAESCPVQAISVEPLEEG